MKSIAIIPARIGSKRIKQKNIKDFLGQPIINYSIYKAIESNLFEEVIVSTDSEKVAEIALNAGASVPFIRESSLSDDYADTLSVIIDSIKRVDELMDFDLVCGLYATAPLLQLDFLRDAKTISEANADKYVLPVSRYKHPIHRSFKLNTKGIIKLNHNLSINKRTQDIDINYHDAGQFYFGNKINFLNNKQLLSENSIGLVIPNKFVCDIDDEEDWSMAESQYKSFCI